MRIYILNDACTTTLPNATASFFICACIVVCTSILFDGCFIIRPVAGASFDREQIQKAREAKTLEIKLQSAQHLQQRLSNGVPFDNADISFYFNQEMLNKAASQLDSTTGWLDSLNSYFIRNIRVTLNNGSAIATMSLAVYNYEYDVNVNLLVDCLLSFKVDNNVASNGQGKLYAQFEPFTIVPNVSAGGLLSTMENVISDIVELKLSEMSQLFPPIELPIDFSNQFPIQTNTVTVRTGINMDVTIPGQMIQYGLQLKEVLIFKNTMFVALNVTKVNVEE
ncbi:MAG: hypothetical protein PHP42_01970 [Bacteroidota bacterium]|nr:hypothetical protein [Bacteroidota bacterium]